MSVFFPDLLAAMMRYNAGDPKRIQHALKVFAYASLIGEAEGLDARTLDILKTAAALHDIGIHNAERLHGSADGKWQEVEGPPAARELLAPFGLNDAFVERVCFLIAHHHTYGAVDRPDYRILVEADFLVNLYEDGASPEAARRAGETVFRTRTGKEFLTALFPQAV